jgi:hypothetical protein
MCGSRDSSASNAAVRRDLPMPASPELAYLPAFPATHQDLEIVVAADQWLRS